MLFSKKLKYLIDKKGVSQKELAEDLGISDVSISRYLSNERYPRASILSKIANYFNVSTDYLLNNSDTGKPVKKIPEKFESPLEAVQFILDDNNNIKFNEFTITKLSDDEKLEIANELLDYLKFLLFKREVNKKK